MEWLTGSVTHFTELDFYEAFPSGVPPDPRFAVGDWNGNSSSFNSNDSAAGQWTQDTNFHVYGTLWVPMALNGGTGLIKRYYDHNEVTSCAVSYTAGGLFSLLETQHQMVIINAGVSWPSRWDYVAMWQTNSSGRTVQ